MKSLALVILAVFATACGSNNPNPFQSAYTPPPPVGVPGDDGVVVKARATFAYSTGQSMASTSRLNLGNLFMSTAQAASPGTEPVTVTLAPNVTMTMDNSKFVTPAMTNSILDFGTLAISALQDNDLKHCGTNSNQKCGTALFRIYTTGTNGAGFYNATDGYGAPMTAGPAGNLQTVGLNVAGAAVVQKYTITNSRNTVKLTDFSPAPVYDFQGDFTDAGAGTYATTITVEFAIAP